MTASRQKRTALQNLLFFLAVWRGKDKKGKVDFK